MRHYSIINCSYFDFPQSPGRDTEVDSDKITMSLGFANFSLRFPNCQLYSLLYEAHKMIDN